MISSLRRSLLRVACLAAVLACSPLALAETKVASIFQDNMVLQRDKPVPVWGWADAGAAVEVSFAGQKKQATADKDGAWKVTLDAMPANATGQALTIAAGTATVTRANVLVGEVWIAAGQSNMVAGGPDIDTGVYPHFVPKGKPEVRVISYGAGASLEPLRETQVSGRARGAWATLTAAKSMSLPQYAARVIRDGVDVPVGLIVVAVPGTNQAAWMSKETLDKFPAGAAAGKGTFYDEFLAQCEQKLAAGGGAIKSFDDFKKAQAEWLATGKGASPASLAIQNFPTALYNTRIFPLAPLAVRGVMWHQGEAGPGGPYDQRLVAMVTQWRQLFGQEFVFVWGTLARSTAGAPPLTPVRSGFYRSGGNVGIRKALDLFGPKGNATLVEFYDNGNEVTHWDNKMESGRRMGLAALVAAYGQSHVYTGPRMVSTTVAGKTATVRFAEVGTGLTYEPSINGISGVIVAGKSGPAQWADVKVTGKDTIEVSHPDIAEIVSVAYAESPNPHETLFNSDRLPASPFVGGTDTKASGTVREAPAVSLVKLLGTDAKASLHVAHVRRSGYVFSLKQDELNQKRTNAAQATGKIQAYIPKEWGGYELETGEKPIKAAEAPAPDGGTYLTFDTPATGAWIIVAQKGKAAEYRKVNRY